MRRMPQTLSLVLLTAAFGLTSATNASLSHKHNRQVNLVTTDYDLVDTSYIDRGRMDGIKVGDVFKVSLRGGKTVTQVVVTAVYDRMAAVKIQDSWLLKDGLLANATQRPLSQEREEQERRPSPEIVQAAISTAPRPKAAAPAPIEAPADPGMGGMDAMELPADDFGMPEAPGGDLGLPPAPGGDLGLPPAPGDDLGLPPAPGGDLGLPPAPGGDLGLPPAPGGDDFGASMPSDDFGLPPAPGGDMGLPAAPGGYMDVPPPPPF